MNIMSDLKNLVTACVTITKNHKQWIKKNSLNFSLWVRNKLDEAILERDEIEQTP